MDSKMEDIIGRITQLHKKEYQIESDLKKNLKERSSTQIVQFRIRNESKLKEIRKEIEQEEYKLLEARILKSLMTR